MIDKFFFTNLILKIHPHCQIVNISFGNIFLIPCGKLRSPPGLFLPVPGAGFRIGRKFNQGIPAVKTTG